MTENFKRVHFFNGMLATEDDWNAGHEYHRTMRQFHNRFSVGGGVIRHFRESLLVRATQPAGMRVLVNPGAAIDPEGREILLLDPVTLFFNPEEFAERGTPFQGFVFVVLRYDERPEAFAVSATDARIQGHKRVKETAVVTLEREEPTGDGMELGRIYWTPECNRISDAVSFNEPRPGEVNLQYVRYMGASGGRIDQAATLHLINALDARDKFLRQLMIEFEVQEAQLPRPAILTARTLLKKGDLDGPTSTDLLRTILDLEEEMTQLIGKRSGEWERVWVSTEYRKYQELLSDAHQKCSALMNGPLPQMDQTQYRGQVSQSYDRFRRVNGALESLVRHLPEMLTASQGPAPYPEVSAEALAVWSKPEMPRRLALGGTPYVLVDQLDITNVASEEAHRFRIDAGPKDVVEGSTPGTYPGGGQITDSGISYRRGSIQFVIGDLVPGKDVLLVRRVEMRDLAVTEEVRVDDQVVGSWIFEGNDSENCWKNVFRVVQGEYIAAPRPRIRLQLGGESSPSNLYRIWVFQAR